MRLDFRLGFWNKKHGVQMRILTLLLLLAGLFLIYYGGVMLLFVPGDPGEPYLSTGRVGLGVLPASGGVGLLIMAILLWLRRKRALAR